jgi:hypothetical protein
MDSRISCSISHGVMLLHAQKKKKKKKKKSDYLRYSRHFPFMFLRNNELKSAVGLHKNKTYLFLTDFVYSTFGVLITLRISCSTNTD